MKIRHLTIENFRAIERLDFDCSKSMNVFIGDNGAGKSTVLEAIVLLYSWLHARLSSPKGKGRNIRNEDVRIGASYCFLSIEVEHRGQSAYWSLMKDVAPDDALVKSTDLRELEPLVWNLREHHEDERYMFSVYGVNRNVSSVSLDKSV
jgi:recombinational DNA repair ATPase RecF